MGTTGCISKTRLTLVLEEELLCNVSVELLHRLLVEHLQRFEPHDELVLEAGLGGHGVPVDGEVPQAGELLEDLSGLGLVGDLVVEEAEGSQLLETAQGFYDQDEVAVEPELLQLVQVFQGPILGLEVMST
jgi:hypothetical protein